VLFNVIGTCWALVLIEPLLAVVEFLTPGSVVSGAGNTGAVNTALIPTHLAMFHTVFNALNTLFFLPFVKPFAALVSFLIKDDRDAAFSGHYRLEYKSGSLQDTPELNILRVEKEIRDMGGVASSMYAKIGVCLKAIRETGGQEAVDTLVAEMKAEEEYADEMREALTAFLIECTREHLNRRTENRVTALLRIIADLEDMTDDCYSISLLLERSVKKNRIFRGKEMEALEPYIALVDDFLTLLRENLGRQLTDEEREQAGSLEAAIDRSRDYLRKLGRKRIEAGVNVKTELLFIDLVRRIEKLGDYCYDIMEALSRGAA
jgi:phosphate:Na+ symporter